MFRIRRRLTSILLSACGMAFAVPCHAGYRLNGEVKNPTPALQEAAEIGVRLYNNEAMQDLLSEVVGGNLYAEYPLMPENDRGKKYFDAGM